MDEKMENCAVNNTPEDVLKSQFSLTTGGSFALKAFCKKREDNFKSRERMNKLIEQIKQGKEARIQKKDYKKERKETSMISAPLVRPKNKRFFLGWMHAKSDGKTEKYFQVRMNKGGGTKEVTLPGNSSKPDIIDYAKSKYFPEGQSHFGSVQHVQFDLTNSQDETLIDLKDENGNSVPFTLQNYSECTKFSRLQLYLATKNLKSTVEKHALDKKEHKNKETKRLKGEKWRKRLNENLASQDNVILSDDDEKKHYVLLETSDVRQTIKEQQDLAYQMSLRKDQQKEKRKKKKKAKDLKREADKLMRLEKLRLSREARVPPEPLPVDKSERVRVAVQHPQLGRISRFFYKQDRVIAVYDWVGSLSTEPEYFSLCASPRQPCLPNTLVHDVAGILLFIEEEENGLVMWPEDPNIQFLGYMKSCTTNDDTVPLDSDPSLNLDDLLGINAENSSSDISLYTVTYTFTQVHTYSNQPQSLSTAVHDCQVYGDGLPQEMHSAKQSQSSSALGDSALSANHPLRSSTAAYGLPSTKSQSPSIAVHDLEVNTFQQPDIPSAATDVVSTANQPDSPSAAAHEIHEVIVQPQEPSDTGVSHIPENQSNFARPKRILKVRRICVLQDIINAFSKPDIMSSSIQITMIIEFGREERGLDDGGILRDALSAFWEEFYNACATREDERVPTLRHDFKTNEWESIARIFVVGFKELKFIPFKICKPFLVACLFGEAAIPNTMLLESFRAYIFQDERELVSASFKGPLEEEQQSEWLEFLDRFSCKRAPFNDPVTVETVLLEVGHKELVQESNYIIESWIGPFKELRSFPDFESIVKLESLYEQVKPTTKKVIDLFQAAPDTNAQRQAFDYLKRFIRGLSPEKLAAFLRFCTGGSSICVSQIGILFTDVDGLQRRLVAHTCAPYVELPTTYTSFPQFREEVNNILSTNFWDIDFA